MLIGAIILLFIGGAVGYGIGVEVEEQRHRNDRWAAENCRCKKCEWFWGKFMGLDWAVEHYGFEEDEESESEEVIGLS